MFPHLKHVYVNIRYKNVKDFRKRVASFIIVATDQCSGMLVKILKMF